jgi:subtilisin family serine protease
MSEEKRAVVTLHKGVNAEEFLDNMTTTFGSDAIPSRAVTLHNEKPDSISNFDFVLTQAEAETLKNDPRVRDVRWGSKLENGFVPMHSVTEPARNHNRDNTVDNTDYPWAFAECTSPTSRYGGGTTFNFAHTYNLDGTGVDCVIQDSGIEVGHPEWKTRDGSTSRLKQIDWPSAAGLSGTYTQGGQHYTDQYGHGTHCASTTAGKLYGWANNADIYAIKIFDTDAFGVSASFNLIRGWHNLKGTGRPTVVNMSWGYFGEYTNINGGNWRGTPWSGNTMRTDYGMIQAGNLNNSLTAYTHGVRVTSVDSDIEDCIADGVILVAAAGNDYHKQDVVGGDDYNNYFVSTLFGNRYYHRGSTPSSSANVVSVGAIDYQYTGGQERQTNFSTTGPRTDIYAPGYAIQAAIPTGATLSSNTAQHPDDSNYLIRKLQGTSMASPQVAGIIATILQARPHYTQQDALDWLAETAASGRLTDPTTGTPATDYVNYYALQGAPNRYLQTPFTSGFPYRFTGGISFSS